MQIRVFDTFLSSPTFIGKKRRSRKRRRRRRRWRRWRYTRKKPKEREKQKRRKMRMPQVCVPMCVGLKVCPSACTSFLDGLILVLDWCLRSDWCALGSIPQQVWLFVCIFFCTASLAVCFFFCVIDCFCVGPSWSLFVSRLCGAVNLFIK